MAFRVAVVGKRISAWGSRFLTSVFKIIGIGDSWVLGFGFRVLGLGFRQINECTGTRWTDVGRMLDGCWTDVGRAGYPRFGRFHVVWLTMPG
jgi:hypothetical protein